LADAQHKRIPTKLETIPIRGVVNVSRGSGATHAHDHVCRMAIVRRGSGTNITGTLTL
jgi:hypothetical protein